MHLRNVWFGEYAGRNNNITNNLRYSTYWIHAIERKMVIYHSQQVPILMVYEAKSAGNNIVPDIRQYYTKQLDIPMKPIEIAPKPITATHQELL